MSEIIAQNVCKIFETKDNNGNKEKTVVLDDFNLEVKKGEFLAILGPSGCGKSTFLSILAGLARQDTGRVLIAGNPVTGTGQNRGVVFQGYALFPWLTVLENIQVGLEIRGLSKKEREPIAREYLALVGLQDFANRYPQQLSGGMKQRVAIARALAYDPDVLLMDEPFAALDAQTRELLQLELLKIWEDSRKTIVFVTHSIDEAVFMADRVAVMQAHPGKVKKIIDVNLPRPRTEEVRNSVQFSKIRQVAWNLLRDEVLAQSPSINVLSQKRREREVV